MGCAVGMDNRVCGESLLTGGLIYFVGVIDTVKGGKMSRDSQEPECYGEETKNRARRQDDNPLCSFHKPDSTFRNNEFGPGTDIANQECAAYNKKNKDGISEVAVFGEICKNPREY